MTRIARKLMMMELEEMKLLTNLLKSMLKISLKAKKREMCRVAFPALVPRRRRTERSTISPIGRFGNGVNIVFEVEQSVRADAKCPWRSGYPRCRELILTMPFFKKTPWKRRTNLRKEDRHQSA